MKQPPLQTGQQQTGVLGQLHGVRLLWGKGIDKRALLSSDMDRGYFWLQIIIVGLVVLWAGVASIFFVAGAPPRLLMSGVFWLRSELYPLWLGLLAIAWLLYQVVRYRQRYAHAIPIGQPADGLVRDVAVLECLSSEIVTALKSMWDFVAHTKTNQITPLHLVRSLLQQSTVQGMFLRIGIAPDRATIVIDKLLKQVIQPRSDQVVHYSPQIQKMLWRAFEVSVEDHQEVISSASMLQAAVAVSPLVQELFVALDVSEAAIQDMIQWYRIDTQLQQRYQTFRRFAVVRPRTDMNRAMTALATPFLDQFSRDITRLAQHGHLDFCLGRDTQINELFRVVEAGSSAVVLVGPQGVGKTTIIGAIAEKMIIDQVPALLKDKRLVSLSLPRLLSGGAERGIEQRLIRIRDEIVRAGNIVLYIEDVHDLVGASGHGQEGLDISEMLARLIERGDFPVLATSNTMDFRRYVEGGTLGTVLQAVQVGEPSPAEILQILQSKVGRYESQYGVYYSLQALYEIQKLASRFLHDVAQPEQAIRLMEQTALYVKNIRGEQQVVLAADVDQLVSEKIHMPLQALTHQESTALLQLEDTIHRRMVNQSPAVKTVASALRRARTELRDTSRPIVNLLFLGPTGVGKTELAKTVAESYFGSEEELVRLDMSEYQSVDTIKRLIGSEFEPKGGYLTEQIRHKPYTVLLLDELEKAHPDILNIFLQVMDDGRLTDWSGQTIDFTNVILIATSNAGTQYIQEQMSQGVGTDDIADALVRTQLQAYFRPEFLNRFDDIVVFGPLSVEHIEQIARLFLAKTQQRLAQKGIDFSVTDEAVRALAHDGYDPQFGARPMRRLIEGRVNDALAQYLLSGKITRRDQVVYQVGGKLSVKKATQL